MKPSPTSAALLLGSFALGFAAALYGPFRREPASPISATPTASAVVASHTRAVDDHTVIKPDLTGRDTNLDLIVSRLIRAQPSDLADRLAKGQSNLFFELFEAVADENPALAAAIAGDIKDPHIRKLALEQAGFYWCHSDPTAAWNWFNTLKGDDYAAAFNSVFPQYSSHNPIFAAQAATTITDPELRTEAINRAATEWTRRDPAAAFTWMEGLKDTKDYVIAYRASLQAYAMTVPEKAYEHIKDLPDTKLKHEITRTIGSAIAHRDIHAGLDWVRTVQDPMLQNAVIEGLSNQLDVMFADGGYSPAFKNIRTEEINPMLDVVTPLVNGRYSEAARALGQAPANKIPFLAEQVIPRYLAKDPIGLRTWATALPDGSLREIVMEAIQNSELRQ